MKTNQPETSIAKLWIVEYSNHDVGSSSGHFVRKTQKDAERSAKLMKECGYQTVTVREFK